jgi:hypothetical protein
MLMNIIGPILLASAEAIGLFLLICRIQLMGLI